MGERLEIEVDFKTQQGVQNVQTLNRALEENLRVTEQVTQRVEKADRQFMDLAKSAGSTTKNFEMLSEAEFDAKRRLEEFGERVKQTRLDEFSEKVRKLREEKAKLAAQTSGVAAATSILTSQVTSLVGAYAGIGGIIKLVEMLNQRTQEAIAARTELFSGKWGRDQILATVMDNLGLTGRAGENKARGLVNQMAQASASNFETAAATVASSQATGFDVNSSAGMGVATGVGQFSSRLRLGPKETELVFKLLSNRGVRDPKQAAAILSKLEKTAQTTGITNNRELMGAMLKAVDASVLRGGDLDKALAEYSTAATGSASAEGGAEQVEMFYTLADPGHKQAREALAIEAARRGATSVSMPSRRQVDAYIAAGQGEKASKAADLTNTLADRRIAETKADEDYKRSLRDRQDHISDLEYRSTHAKHPHEREVAARELADARTDMATAQADRQRDMGKRQRQQDEDQRHMTAARQDVVGEMIGGNALSEFNKLSFDQKVAFVKSLFAEAEGDPQKQAYLLQLFGGRPELIRAAQIQSGRAFRDRAATALPLIRNADPAMQAKRFEEFKTTSVARQNLSSAGSQAANDSAISGAVEEEAQRLMERGTERGKLAAHRGEKDPLGHLFVSQEEYGKYKQLLEETQSFLSTMSDQERSQFPELEKLRYEIAHDSFGMTEAQSLQRMYKFAIRFLQIKAKIESSRKSGAAGGPQSNAGGSIPLPEGAVSTGPIASAMSGGGGGNVIVHYNPGIVFTHPAIVRDLPGPLDGLG